MTETDTTKCNDFFWPLLLALASMVLWAGFQTTEFLRERSTLASQREQQVGIYDTAEKMRAQLDAIAAGTARLAKDGNPRAAQLVERLRSRGVTINSENSSAPGH